MEILYLFQIFFFKSICVPTCAADEVSIDEINDSAERILDKMYFGSSLIPTQTVSCNFTQTHMPHKYSFEVIIYWLLRDTKTCVFKKNVSLQSEIIEKMNCLSSRRLCLQRTFIPEAIFPLRKVSMFSLYMSTCPFPYILLFHKAFSSSTLFYDVFFIIKAFLYVIIVLQ